MSDQLRWRRDEAAPLPSRVETPNLPAEDPIDPDRVSDDQRQDDDPGVEEEAQRNIGRRGIRHGNRRGDQVGPI